MSPSIRSALVLVTLSLLAPAARGHFNMLLPESTTTKKGEPVTILYQWGHPFEHQLFAAPPPRSVLVLAPDGGRKELTRALEQVSVPGADKTEVTAYRFRFNPEQRGDYTFVLQTPPIWMEESEEFYQDSVRVVLHVQVQRGWDLDVGRQFQIVPLTRPYGLQAGMVFQAQVLVPGKLSGTATEQNQPQAGTLVQIERYNVTPPREKDLPPDEHITRASKTDPNGVVTGTLTEPGWWCLTAQREAGRREHNGKAYPLRQRVTLWVFVDEKATAK